MKVFSVDDTDDNHELTYNEFSGPKLAQRLDDETKLWIAEEDLSDPRTAGWGLGQD